MSEHLSFRTLYRTSCSVGKPNKIPRLNLLEAGAERRKNRRQQGMIFEGSENQSTRFLSETFCAAARFNYVLVYLDIVGVGMLMRGARNKGMLGVGT